MDSEVFEHHLTSPQGRGHRPSGAFTVTLSDGEVWAQAAEDEVYHPAHWHDPGPNMLVTIAPDAMHTFTLTVAGESRYYKVKRIR